MEPYRDYLIAINQLTTRNKLRDYNHQEYYETEHSSSHDRSAKVGCNGL